MAGDLGKLSFSLEVNSKIDEALKRYVKLIGEAETQMGKLEGKIQKFKGTASIEKARKALEKYMDTGRTRGKHPDTFEKQGEKLEKLKQAVVDAQAPLKKHIQEYSRLIAEVERYTAAMERVKSIQDRVTKGGIVNPRTFTTFVDTGGLEERITRLERIKALVAEITEVQKSHRPGVAGHDYSARLGKLGGELKSLGGEGMSVEQMDYQLRGLYATLISFSSANERARRYVESAATAERDRARAVKDARVAFEPLVAAQRRQEEQEKANRAAMEASRASRAKTVESLRRESEAMTQARIAELNRQKASLGGIYVKGRKAGLGEEELERILSRYKAISSELLSLRSMMQNPSQLGYRDMFETGRVTGPGAQYVREAAAEVTRLRQRTEESSRAADRLSSAFARVQDSASRTRGVLDDIKSLFLQGGIVFGARQFFNSVVQTGGDIAQQHVALRVLLNDIKEADALFGRVQQLALQSPFTFPELNRDVKQLAAFGVETENLYDTMSRLADISSGLGVSFERLGLAYGQTKARSWLDGKELRQFAYAGLPMLQKIADLYNETGKNGRNDYTTGDIRKMVTKREVSFADVDTVIRRLTDEGGQFYHMQFDLSATLLGRWNKLIDAWTIMLGKFADGKSITGRIFSAAIDQTTEFVLALDKIAPALIAAGAAYMGKSLITAGIDKSGLNATSKTVGVMRQAQALQLKSYAMSQMREVSEGRISAEVMRQNVLRQKELLQSKQVQGLAYARLFAEGRVSAMQLAGLLRGGQIEASMVRQLAVMGLISNKQARLVLQAGVLGNKWQRMVATMRLGADSLMGSVASLVSPANIAMTAIGAAMALWMSYKQWSDGIDQKVQNAVDSARQGLEKLKSAIQAAEQSGPTAQAVKNMKEILENSDLYTETMRQQVDKADTLQEKYDTMLATLKEMKALQDETKESPLVDDYAEVIKSTKGSWSRWLKGRSLSSSTGDITENLQGYLTGQAKYDNAASVLKEYESEIKAAMSSLKGEYGELYKSIQGKPFDEQLRLLAESPAWNRIRDLVSKQDKAFKGFAFTFTSAKLTLEAGWKDIIEEDIPEMAKAMAKQRNMELSDYKKFCQKHPEMAGAAIRQLVSSINVGDKELEAKLINTLLAYFGVVGQNAVVRAPRLPGAEEEDVLSDEGTHLKKVTAGILSEAEVKTIAGENADYATVASNIKREYKGAKENEDAATLAGVADEVRQPLSEETEKWRKAAEKFGVDLSEKKTDTDGDKGSKLDNRDFKNLQARLKLIEGAYSMYRQYYGKMNNEGAALAKVRETYNGKGLSNYDFQSLTSLSRFASLMDEYISKVRAFTPRNSENVPRKDELIASGVESREKLGFQMLEEDIKGFTSAVDKATKDLSRKWSVYETVLGQTGDSNEALSVAGLTGGNPLYSDYLKKYVEKLMPAGQSLDTSRLTSMSDEEISKYAGSLFAADDAKKVEGLASALKQLRDQLADKELTDAVKEVADLFGKVVTPAAVKAREETNRMKTDALISASPFGDSEKKKATSIATEEFKAAILKSSSDYRRLMSGSSVGGDKANATAQSVKDSLGARLGLGTITEEDFATELTEAMDKAFDITNRLGDTALYLTSGLDAVYGRMIKEGADKIAAGIRMNAEEEGTGSSLISEGQNQMQKGYDGKSYLASTKQVSSAANTLVKAFNSLSSALDPVMGLAEALGNTGIAEGAGIAKSAVNSGLSTFNAMEGMSDVAKGMGASGLSSALSAAGPYAAAAGMALSVASSILGGKSSSMKAFEEQAAYLKSIDETTGEINSSLKEDLKSSIGSKSITAARNIIKNTELDAEETRKTYLSWTNAKKHKWGHRNRVKTGLDYDLLNDWLKANGYSTGSYVGSQEIQNLSGQVLKEFRNANVEAWAHMNSEAREYLEKIIEIEAEGGELEETTQSLAEALGGFNIESLSSDWAALLADLDSQTDDFADSLEEKMRSAILESMTANLYKSQIEALTAKSTELGQNLSYLSTDGTVRSHYLKDSNGNYTYAENDIASEYTAGEYNEIMDRAEVIAGLMKNSRDMLAEMYGWSMGSSSMSSSVQGITEQTGDLLASYLNAIRADVSVLRQLDGTAIPEMGTVMKAQLQQLNMIASNTMRSADAAERMEQSVSGMYDIFNRARNGTDSLTVKVK